MCLCLALCNRSALCVLRESGPEQRVFLTIDPAQEHFLLSYLKPKSFWDRAIHWTNPSDIPRTAEFSRGTGGVKGGYAAAARS